MIYKVEDAKDTMKEMRIEQGAKGNAEVIQAFIDCVRRQGGEMFIVSTVAEASYEQGYEDGKADMAKKIKKSLEVCVGND